MSASSPSGQRAIDPLLFDWPFESPALLGSRCVDCGALAFPVTPSCTACGGTAVNTERLPRHGKLWTWTVQRFMPKTPYRSAETAETFRPYGIGYVELDGALRVETRLVENEPDELRIGADVELVFYTHRVDDDGTAVINYAFQLVRAEGNS